MCLTVGNVNRRQWCPLRGGIGKKPDVGGNDQPDGQTPGLMNRNRIKGMHEGMSLRFKTKSYTVRIHAYKCGRQMGGRLWLLPGEVCMERWGQ